MQVIIFANLLLMLDDAAAGSILAGVISLP
jgi:hypothetical protein